MSDEHPNQQLEINWQANDSYFDADRVTSTSEVHEQHELHDSRYWHAACRVRDCKFGFPECKVGSYCCKAGWKNVLEEPFFRARSLGMASKRPGSVTMLPSLLSNLTVSRTRSDPCIFGKDFLRITLPLPGEPGDSAEKDRAIEKTECGVIENLDEPMNLFGTGTGEDSPVLEAPTSPFIVPCKRILSKTRDNLDNDSLFGVQYSFDMEFSESFGVILSERTMGNLGNTSSDKNAAANSQKEGVSNSRTPQFDDCWTWQSNECTQRNKHPVHRRTQYKNKSKEHYLTFAEEIEMDQAEEEGLEEGYVVFEEHEDEQLRKINDEGNACDDGEEQSMLYLKQDIINEYLEEELFEDGETNTENSPKRYKEDDIWSDEHFVSSQAKGFPPPISILANETHPGLPGHMPRTLWRSVKRDGRFVLQEVQAQPREFFRATRECGRLRLQLVRPDLDPLGSYMEATAKEDSAGSVSAACASSIENLAGVLSTVKLEESGIVHKGDRSRASTQEISAPQPEDCWTSERGAKLGVALDKSDPKRLMPSNSSSEECVSVLEVETQDPSQKWKEMFIVGSSATVGLQEVFDSSGRDMLTKISCMTNHSQISEESWRGKMALDKTLSRNTNCLIAYESQFQDLGEEGSGRVSDLGKADYREKPIGLCLSDVEAGISSDTGAKQNIGQIDAGERTMEIKGFVDLCTKLDVGQVVEVKDLGMGNHSNVVVPHEEQFTAYQHPCFNPTYGFDNNLKALSPSQAFIPIQPAVR